MAFRAILLLCLAAGAEAVVLRGAVTEGRSADDSRPGSASGVAASMQDVIADELVGAATSLLYREFGPEIVEAAVAGDVGPDASEGRKEDAKEVLDKIEEIASGVASEFKGRGADAEDEAEDEDDASSLHGDAGAAVVERAETRADHRLMQAGKEAAQHIAGVAEEVVEAAGEMKAGLEGEASEEAAEEEAGEVLKKVAHGVETIAEAVAPVVDEFLEALGGDLDED